jgi:hypothetical protein
MLSRFVTGLALALAFAAPALAGDAQPPHAATIDPHSPAAAAADAHLAAAARLQRIAMPREMTLTVINTMVGVLNQRLSAGADPAKAARIDEIIRQIMTPATDGLDAIVAAHFASRFSDAQIGEYTAFFSQPIYTRDLSEMPSIMSELTTWILDREQGEVNSAFERARARGADGTPIAPAAAAPDVPSPDAHTALILAMFEHAQSDHSPMEEVLWRSQARKLKDVDDATRQRIHDAFLAEIAPRVPAYRLQLAQIFARRFSDDELKQLDAFYSSPVYRDFMGQLAIVMKDVQPEFLAWMKTNVLPNLVKSLQQMKSQGASP